MFIEESSLELQCPCKQKLLFSHPLIQFRDPADLSIKRLILIYRLRLIAVRMWNVAWLHSFLSETEFCCSGSAGVTSASCPIWDMFRNLQSAVNSLFCCSFVFLIQLSGSTAGSDVICMSDIHKAVFSKCTQSCKLQTTERLRLCPN